MAGLLTCAERWPDAAFYRNEYAEDHFFTDPMRSNRIAEAVAARIRQLVGDRPVEVFDIGAGNGALLRALVDVLPNTVMLHGIDYRDQPAGTPGIWHQQDARTLPQPCTDALPVLICHEFLDDVPCDLVEVDDEGVARLMLVDDDGAAVLGPRLTDSAAGPERQDILRWMQRWWPATRPLMRIEVGRWRDALWRYFTHRVTGGLAFAIDYGHLLPERLVGTWDGGTATGWRYGHAAAIRWDGSRNVTAHVAMDAVAHATAGSVVRIHRTRHMLDAGGSTALSTGAIGDYLWLEADLRGSHA